MPAKRSTPTPVHVKTICSVCGLDWERHGENPTKDECIALLRAEVAKVRPAPIQIYPTVWPERPLREWPTWWNGKTVTSGTTWETSKPIMLKGV